MFLSLSWKLRRIGIKFLRGFREGEILKEVAVLASVEAIWTRVNESSLVSRERIAHAATMETTNLAMWHTSKVCGESNPKERSGL